MDEFKNFEEYLHDLRKYATEEYYKADNRTDIEIYDKLASTLDEVQYMFDKFKGETNETD